MMPAVLGVMAEGEGLGLAEVDESSAGAVAEGD